MVEVTARIKECGKTVGVFIEKEKAIKAHLNHGEEVRLLIMKKKNPLKEMFGIAKFSRSTEKILREVDKYGWNK